MTDRFAIETERLILRNWQDRDRPAFHSMNSDPAVMATIGPPLDRKQADAAIDDMLAGNREGLCLCAVERRSDGVFLGFCGIGRAPVDTPVAGEREIGWRLSHAFWGQGYAREAAEACLRWAWDALPDAHVAAITAAINRRSWGVMERLGMVRYPDEDFDHPKVPDRSPLKRHVVYRIARPSGPKAISRPGSP